MLLKAKKFNREFSTKVKYLIVGGDAVAYHGDPRFAGDVDFLVELSLDNAAWLERVLHDFGLGHLEMAAKIAEGEKSGWRFLKASEVNPFKTILTWGGGVHLHFFNSLFGSTNIVEDSRVLAPLPRNSRFVLYFVPGQERK